MGCGSSVPKEPEPPPPSHAVRRRGSASAQGGLGPNVVNLATLPKVAKSSEDMDKIRECIVKNPLMKTLSEEYKRAVIDAMKEIKVASGDKVITQGELGDFWYVVDKGSLETWKLYEGEEEAKLVRAPHAREKEAWAIPPSASVARAPRQVKSYAVGDAFGELALMFNQRRAASVIAKEECTLWAVDQATFRTVMCAQHPRMTQNSPNPESNCSRGV